MVQLIGNFDFAALCLPTVPWGKSTRKMQFFRKVLYNHLQIDRSILFFESFFLMSVFVAVDLFFLFSSNYFPATIEFSPRGDHQKTTKFRFQFWENQKRQRVHSTMWMFFCTLCTFLSRCVRLEEEKGKKQSEKRHFFLQFQTTLLRRFTSPLKSSINYQKKLTTTNAHIFFSSSNNRTTVSQSSWL